MMFRPFAACGRVPIWNPAPAAAAVPERRMVHAEETETA
jgi:hypothetical protein